LLDGGFSWLHPRLEEALIDLLAPDGRRTPAVSNLASMHRIPAALPKVFAFIADPTNLTAVTPPAMRVAARECSTETMQRGTTVEYGLRIRGRPAEWRSLIDDYVEGVRFSDVQVRGPFSFWHHVHEFKADGEGTVVTDRVDYALPWAPLSDFALPEVRHDIESAFAYRRRALDDIFG